MLVQVVVASHSWGDNVFRNFLVWVTEDDADWVERHIHAYINIAGPVLGVAKSMTSLLSGADPPLSSHRSHSCMSSLGGCTEGHLEDRDRGVRGKEPWNVL